MRSGTRSVVGTAVVRWIGACLRLGLAIVLAAGLLAVGTVTVLRPASARADEVTGSRDNLRTGWDQNEPGLTPAVVGGGNFGQLFSTSVSGQVYAQPVVAGSTVIVATENDWVYGLDAATGAVKWSVSLGTPWPASSEGCTDLTPNVGVTGTPVYDPGSGTVYLVSEIVPPGNDNYHPAFYMHALNAQTGAEQSGWPVQIQGDPVNAPARPFNAFTSLQRPALLLMGGSVYAAFGSHCDITPYVGSVAGVNSSTRAVTLWTDESGLTDKQAGIWQGGGGLMSDGSGRIFFTSGNGVSPAPGPGSQPPPELAESTVRLAVQAGGSLAAADFFSPANAPSLDAADTDLGAGAPVGLPFGSSTYPNLLVQAGKDGRMFLLNRNDLGGREQGPGGTDNVVSTNGPYQGEWGHPAVFGDTTTVTSSNSGSASDYVYYVGRNDYLRALRFQLNSSGIPVLANVAHSPGTFGYTSGSPVVTSNGTDPSSTVVWEVYSSGSTGTGGMLEAFDAVPSSSCTSTAQCTLTQIWSAPIGTASKFSVPATDNGRVYVGTRDGTVLGFGSPDAAPLSGAAPVSFGQVGVSTTSPGQDVTVTATTTVTVSSVSATSTSGTDPFTAGTPTQNGSPVSLPMTLSPGDQLTVPVTFAPSAPGGATGALSFATDSANFPTVSVGISGTGTQAGFYAQPASVTFGSVPDGTTATALVNITNGGTASETVSSVTPPNSPFAVTGLPSGTISPGASTTATVTYRPTAAETDTSQFVIDAADGTSLTVSLSGTGIAAVSQFTPSPASVAFGSVPLGTQATQTIDITNTGNVTETVKSTSPPWVPFGAPAPVANGLPVNPSYDIKVPITFTPASIGTVSSRYLLTWTDVTGTHSVTIPVTGTGSAPSSGITVPPPGGGWTLNGSAHMSGSSTLTLTQAVSHQKGSAVYSVPQPSDGLHATFTAQIGGGTGADGMTFALLDAAKVGPAALGGNGAQLGFGGLPGIAVTLDTHKDTGYPSSNFVGIATGAQNGLLTFAATSGNIPNLRSGTSVVNVTVSGQTITVTVDGTQVLSPTLPAGTIPPSVLAAFTGGTGGLTDNHIVTQASITAGGNPVPPPGGGWTYNGTAFMSGSGNVLTPAAANKAGSVVYPTPVNTAGLQVTFNAQLSCCSGGNGLTFALLDPSQATATALGGSGGELGFGGLPGIAVTLVDRRSTGYPSGNFAAISAGTNNGLLTFQTSVKGISPLHTGTHTVTVQVTSGDVLIVYLDGQQVLQRAEPGLTATSLLAFTAGTSSYYQVNTIRNVGISATG
jgi:Abnormal spindle-like microcephaly-assoc'd, ASPM-SPD-2-Hydin/PQQ-like domain